MAELKERMGGMEIRDERARFMSYATFQDLQARREEYYPGNLPSRSPDEVASFLSRLDIRAARNLNPLVGQSGPFGRNRGQRYSNHRILTIGDDVALRYENNASSTMWREGSGVVSATLGRAEVAAKLHLPGGLRYRGQQLRTGNHLVLEELLVGEAVEVDDLLPLVAVGVVASRIHKKRKLDAYPYRGEEVFKSHLEQAGLTRVETAAKRIDPFDNPRHLEVTEHWQEAAGVVVEHLHAIPGMTDAIAYARQQAA